MLRQSFRSRLDNRYVYLRGGLRIREPQVSRWTALGVMMTFFVMLPLDIDVPALNLCLMAVARWAVLAGVPDAVLARGQVA
jgi:hypothetical protein